jgi:hypothetical protein
MNSLLPALRRFAVAGPVLAALAAMTAVFLAWGSLDPVPTVGDETAYLLQASLLSHGHVTGAGPPAPEFFEQAHVQVVPVLAPKYPLGFGLALVPGVIARLPALMPLLLTGCCATLLWILARRVAGTGAALITCAIWIASPGARYRAGFFSESLSTPLVLLSWYALLQWRRAHETKWLVAVSLCLAGLAITRPLTAVVFAIPIAIVILPDLVGRRAWRQGIVALLAGLPLLGLLALQNVESGGRWWELTYDRYTRTYLPFDHVGFGLDARAPLRERPADLERLAQALERPHQDFTPSRLPAILLNRIGIFLSDLAGPAAIPALLLLLLGAVVGTRELRFATLSGALLFSVHLIYAHAPEWSIYYSEALPVAAVLVATGTAWLVTRLVQPLSPASVAGPRAALLLAIAALVAWPMPDRILMQRLYLEVSREPIIAFQQAVAGLPVPSIVFVRYAPDQHLSRPLVENQAAASSAPLWTARDRGADNARLLALVPGRSAWLYDQAAQRLLPLALSGTP